MDTSKLRPDTRQVWERLRDEPRLNGFVLIGGSALTLRIACMRLQTERLPASDEGYVQLLDDAPVRETITRFFVTEIDALRTELARRAFQARRHEH